MTPALTWAWAWAWVPPLPPRLPLAGLESGTFSPVEGFSLACWLWLFFRTWRGWRAGLLRELTAVLALAAAVAIIFTRALPSAEAAEGAGAAPAWGGGGDMARLLLRSLFANGLFALFVYVVIRFAGKVLFGRGRHRAPGPVRLVGGAGGAALGFLRGLVGVLVAVGLVRLAGAAAEGYGRARGWDAPDRRAAGGAVVVSAGPRRGWEGALHGAGTIKQALEGGPAGTFFEALDPVPAAWYDGLRRLAYLAGDPRLLGRLVDAPTVRQGLAGTRLGDLLARDPAVARALAAGDPAVLWREPRLAAALNDPRLWSHLARFDWRQTMDELLRADGPDPRGRLPGSGEGQGPAAPGPPAPERDPARRPGAARQNHLARLLFSPTWQPSSPPLTL